MRLLANLFFNVSKRNAIWLTCQWMTLKSLVELFEDDIYEVLDPKTAVARRNSAGGTGFEQIKIAIDKGKKCL